MRKPVAALLGISLWSSFHVVSVEALPLTADDQRIISELRGAVPHLRHDEVAEFFKLATSHVGRDHLWQTLSARTPGQSFLSIHDGRCWLTHAGKGYLFDSAFGTFRDPMITPVAFAYNTRCSRGYLLTIRGSAGELMGTRFVGAAGKFKQTGVAHDGLSRKRRGLVRVSYP